MPRLLLSVLAIGLLTSAVSVRAQESTYSYDIVHPFYGTIGTFTESIERTGDVTRLDSHVHVAVKILGIVAHREDGDHTEIFRGDRLVSLESTTTTNGTRIDVRGEARGDHFVVTSPTGVMEAPADVAPSDPWVLNQPGAGTVISIKTGRIIPTRVTGGEAVTVPLQGATVSTRHFTAIGERQQEVWLNDRNVPVKFRSVESGTAIDFILTTPWRDAAAGARLVPTAKLQPAN